MIDIEEIKELLEEPNMTNERAIEIRNSIYFITSNALDEIYEGKETKTNN